MQDLIRGDRELVITQLKNLVTEYDRIRDSGDAQAVQNVRDNLASIVNLTGFDVVANARSQMEMAEIIRKRKVAETELNYFAEVGKEKRFASKDEARNQALLDCGQYYDKELEANRTYYLARELSENLKTFENSVASRMRMLINE